MARIHPGPPLLEVKADKRTAADWKPAGPARVRVVEHDHWLPLGLQALQRCSGFLIRRARGSTVATHHFRLEVEPDQRAGTASKADRSTLWDGEHFLRLPPFCFGLAEQQMHSPCKRAQTGAAPVAGSL